MRHVLTVSGGASSPDSDDESTRASQRRKPPADEGHPALPDGAVVPLAPVRESHHRVEALAWNSDDGGARETPPATSHDDRSADEGRSCCVTRLGGRQRLRAFTGELGLDPARCTATAMRLTIAATVPASEGLAVVSA